MNVKVSYYIDRLDNLFQLADGISDDEVKGHFAKYLCIRTSGLIEVFFKTQLEDYVTDTSPLPIANYVNNRFKTFTNINSKKIHDLLEVFSPLWAEQYDNKMTEELTSSLNSVISNRNNIAHGNNDSISMPNVKIYYENVKDIILILDDIISKRNRK